MDQPTSHLPQNITLIPSVLVQLCVPVVYAYIGSGEKSKLVTKSLRWVQNITVGRKLGGWSTIIPTMHGTSFCGLIIEVLPFMNVGNSVRSV